MPWRRLTLVLMCVALGSCSYAYELLAVTQNDQLVFVVDPKSGHKPSCLREVEVTAEGGARARPQAGDDADRVSYGTFWSESVDYDDDCANKFPLPYGTSLKGRRLTNGDAVTPKPLLREAVYEVHTTTGATGYGSGRFVIHANGRIANLR